MGGKGPVVVLTSKIVYNTGKFIVNMYVIIPRNYWFQMGRKRQRKIFFLLGLPGLDQGWHKGT